MTALRSFAAAFVVATAASVAPAADAPKPIRDTPCDRHDLSKFPPIKFPPVVLRPTFPNGPKPVPVPPAPAKPHGPRK